MKKSLRPLFAQALADELDSLTFLDLDRSAWRVSRASRPAGGPGRTPRAWSRSGIVASRPH